MAIMKDPNDTARLENVLKGICSQYRIDRKDFIRAEYERDERGYPERVALEFKPAVYDMPLRELALSIERQLSEPFVGDVTRAAAPKLSAAAIKLADAILKPQNRVIFIDARVFMDTSLYRP